MSRRHGTLVTGVAVFNRARTVAGSALPFPGMHHYLEVVGVREIASTPLGPWADGQGRHFFGGVAAVGPLNSGQCPQWVGLRRRFPINKRTIRRGAHPARKRTLGLAEMSQKLRLIADV